METKSELASLIAQVDENVQTQCRDIETKLMMSEALAIASQRIIDSVDNEKGLAKFLCSLVLPSWFQSMKDMFRLVTISSKETGDMRGRIDIIRKDVGNLLEACRKLQQSQLPAASASCEIWQEGKSTPAVDNMYALIEKINSTTKIPSIEPKVEAALAAKPAGEFDFSLYGASSNQLRKSIVKKTTVEKAQPVSQPVQPVYNVAEQPSFDFKVSEARPINLEPPLTEIEDIPKIPASVRMTTTQEAAEILGVSASTVRTRIYQLVQNKEITERCVFKGRKGIGKRGMNSFPYDLIEAIRLSDKDVRRNSFLSRFGNLKNASEKIGLTVDEIKTYINSGTVSSPDHMGRIQEWLSVWEGNPLITDMKDVKIGDKFKIITPSFVGLTINTIRVEDGKSYTDKKNIKTLFEQDDRNSLVNFIFNRSELEEKYMKALLAMEFEAVEWTSAKVIKLKYDMPPVVYSTRKTGEILFNHDTLPKHPVKIHKLI